MDVLEIVLIVIIPLINLGEQKNRLLMGWSPLSGAGAVVADHHVDVSSGRCLGSSVEASNRSEAASPSSEAERSSIPLFARA